MDVRASWVSRTLAPPSSTQRMPASAVLMLDWVSLCTEWIRVPISCVDCAVFSDSFLISSAMTAKGLPYSPAAAERIAALTARRSVCSAMSVMTSTMPPISLDFKERRRIAWTVAPTLS